MVPPTASSQRLAELELVGLDPACLHIAIADEARGMLGAQSVSLWIREGASQRFVPCAGEDGVVEVTKVQLDAIPDSPQFDIEVDAGPWGPFLLAGRVTDDGPLAVDGLPLRAGGTVLAVLLVRRRPGGSHDLAAATSFARQAAAVLSNWRALADVARSRERLSALYETARELSARLDLETVLSAIVVRARAMSNSPISYIMLVDQEAGAIYMRVTSGIADEEFTTLRLDIGEGLGGWVADRLHHLESSDYLNDPRFSHHHTVDRAVRGEGVKSILGVPLGRSDHFVGVLYVADRRVRRFDESEIAVLTTLADHAAVAIDNAALYEQATGALAEVERANELLSVQYARRERAEQLNASLSAALLAGHGLAQVVELMAEFVGERVFVADEHLRVLAEAGEPADLFGERMLRRGVADTVRRSRLQIAPPPGASGASEPTVIPAQLPDRSRARLVVPIVSRREVMGSLWVEVCPDALDDQRLLIEQGARVVALDVLMERAVAESERRLGSEFLSELFSAQDGVPGALQHRAVELGIDLDEAHRLVVVWPSPAEEGDELAAVRARGDAIARLRSAAWCPFVSEWSGRVVALVRDAGWDVAQELERIVCALPGGETSVHAALSMTCAAVADYRREFVACDKVLAVLAGEPGRKVIDLRDARVLGLLFREGGDEVADFARSVLGPLLNGDARNAELLRTLEVYLDSGGSPSQTAAGLQVHVNTVYYRLAAIREQLGPAFDEPQAALDLRVALLARRLIGRSDAPAPRGGDLSLRVGGNLQNGGPRSGGTSVDRLNFRP